MMYKNNFFTIIFGFIFTIISLEIFTILLPASKSFPLVLPIECKDITNLDLSCFHRRRKYISGRYTRGLLPPFPINAYKKANDFGQFSNTDFKDFIDSKDKIRIIAIGDSFSEALQVNNENSYHGLLNKRKIAVDGLSKEIITTTFSAGGMSLPTYLKYLEFAKKFDDLENDYVIFTIVNNDFDESYEKYDSINNNKNKGKFYFNEDDEIYFIPISKVPYDLFLKSHLLKISSFLRYLTFNYEFFFRVKILNSKISCFLKQNNCFDIKYLANIVDETLNDNPERYSKGLRAIESFLNKLDKLRPTKEEKIKTILVVDADRDFIQYNKAGVKKNKFFDFQRINMIKKAKAMGFHVINMEPIFENHFKEKKILFNSTVDSHWNELGHKLISNQIMLFMNSN